jgi:hypothetical protein
MVVWESALPELCRLPDFGALNGVLHIKGNMQSEQWCALPAALATCTAPGSAGAGRI